MAAISLLSFTENPVFGMYATYAAAVILKMIFLSFRVAQYRISRRVFVNLEDAHGKKDLVRKDEDIERVLRCHRNDLENIPPFLVLGLLYVLTGPSLQTAAWHFRIFGVSRFIHTVAYLLPLPQPTRALSFAVGAATNISMAVRILMLGQL